MEEVPTRILQDQLGTALAAEAEADFDAPVTAPLMSPMQRQAWSAEIEETARRDAQAKLREHTRHGAGREAAADTRLERIKPGPRKHVSAMREEHGEATRSGPRQRVAKEETSDRRGRKVSVERKSAVPGHAVRNTRNADRFEQEKRRTMRTDASTFGERRVRPPAEEERTPRGKSASRGAPGGDKFGERAPGKRVFAGAASRDERPARPPRGGGKFSEGKFSDSKAYAGRAGEGRGERPARSEGEPFGERKFKAGKFNAGKGEGRPAGRASGPPRAGGKPEGKPGGGRPFGGKSGGKPGGGPRKPRS